MQVASLLSLFVICLYFFSSTLMHVCWSNTCTAGFKILAKERNYNQFEGVCSKNTPHIYSLSSK